MTDWHTTHTNSHLAMLAEFAAEFNFVSQNIRLSVDVSICLSAVGVFIYLSVGSSIYLSAVFRLFMCLPCDGDEIRRRSSHDLFAPGTRALNIRLTGKWRVGSHAIVDDCLCSIWQVFMH